MRGVLEIDSLHFQVDDLPFADYVRADNSRAGAFLGELAGRNCVPSPVLAILHERAGRRECAHSALRNALVRTPFI